VTEAFTILDAGRVTTVEATVSGDRVRVDAGGLEEATGWEHKPEGLCRGSVCVPVRDADLADPDQIELAAFARALGRPLALSVTGRVAALGEAAGERARGLSALQAPDFALPDLEGRVHRLSELRGRKVLLAAYASW
jgi:hypothetical protein